MKGTVIWENTVCYISFGSFHAALHISEYPNDIDQTGEKKLAEEWSVIIQITVSTLVG